MTAVADALDETNFKRRARKRQRNGNQSVLGPEQADLPEWLVSAADRRNRCEGLEFLTRIPDGLAAAAFFDPQYRSLLDNMAYGNEGTSRSRARCALPQMSEDQIRNFVCEIARTLRRSGHMFLWLDKFGLLNGFAERTEGSGLAVVDLIAWDKKRFGLGYRTRRQSEYLVVYQKPPKRAKDIWTSRSIPDVWQEPRVRGEGTHAKPVLLQRALIGAVSNPGDCVVDPAAGSFSVLKACQAEGRTFLGCDING